MNKQIDELDYGRHVLIPQQLRNQSLPHSDLIHKVKFTCCAAVRPLLTRTHSHYVCSTTSLSSTVVESFCGSEHGRNWKEPLSITWYKRYFWRNALRPTHSITRIMDWSGSARMNKDCTLWPSTRISCRRTLFWIHSLGKSSPRSWTATKKSWRNSPTRFPNSISISNFSKS